MLTLTEPERTPTTADELLAAVAGLVPTPVVVRVDVPEPMRAIWRC